LSEKQVQSIKCNSYAAAFSAQRLRSLWLRWAAPTTLLYARSCQVPAFIRANAARLGAALAVVQQVFLTFGSAGVTDVGTETADFSHESRAPTHIAGSTPAHRRAIGVEPNAFAQVPDVLFVQAGILAVFALLGTANTGGDGRLMFLMGHEAPPAHNARS
jgi:hypothetical protein